MEWYHVVATVLGNFAVILPLWLWNRAEARADNRHMLSIVEAIKNEMKDFHGRLCAIEERAKLGNSKERS